MSSHAAQNPESCNKLSEFSVSRITARPKILPRPFMDETESQGSAERSGEAYVISARSSTYYKRRLYPRKEAIDKGKRKIPGRPNAR
jgi:hypothetical protein